MAKTNKPTPGSYEDRTTMGPGQGLIITPPSRTEKPKPSTTKHFVAGPVGRLITEEEARELGRKLYDALHGKT